MHCVPLVLAAVDAFGEADQLRALALTRKLGRILMNEYRTFSGDRGQEGQGRKRHILVDTLGPLLGVSVRPANIQDRDGASDLLRDARRRFPFVERIFADAAYQGPKMAKVAAGAGRWKIEIVERSDLHRFVAEAIGRRTQLCLDQPKPPPDARLRTLRRNRRSLRRPRYDPPQAESLTKPSPCS